MIHLTTFHLTILQTQNTFLFYSTNVSSCFSLKACLISRESEKDFFYQKNLIGDSILNFCLLYKECQTYNEELLCVQERPNEEYLNMT